MASAVKKKEARGASCGKGNAGRQDRSRRIAEYSTLGVSLLLILGIAGYLLYQATLTTGSYHRVEARPLLDQARREGSRYILPIEIANRGRRMLQDVQIEVRLRPPGGPPETREATIDTMGEGSLKRFYLYLSWPPGPGQVTVEPISYRVE